MKARQPFILDPSPICEATRQKAEKELRETPEIVAAALAELRDLLKNDDTIYFKDDDEILIVFLRPCKFYAKSAYELVSFIIQYLIYRIGQMSFYSCKSVMDVKRHKRFHILFIITN